MTTAAPQTLRIRSQSDLLTVIPYLLGFHPSDCVVLIGGRDPKLKHGVFILRVDLPPAEEVGSVVDTIVDTAARARLRSAALVVYAASDRVPDAGRPFVRSVVRRLAVDRIEVAEAIRSDGEHWWGYLCEDSDCCTGVGHPVVPPDRPGGSALIAAQAVAQGWAPLASREELSHALRPVSEIVFAAVDQAMAEVMEEFVRQRDDARNAWRRLRLSTVRLAEELITQAQGRDRVELTPAQAALLLVGLQDPRARDLCMGWTKGECGRAAVMLWTELIRMARPPLGVVPATLLAFAAWQRGGGAIVTMALERALAHDPNDRMARLLSGLVFGGVDPDECSPSQWMDDIADAHARGVAAQPMWPDEEPSDDPALPGADSIGARCA